MKRCVRIALIPTLLAFCFSVPVSRTAGAKDKKLKPEEVVARHLESLGSSEALSAAKSRTIKGVAAVRRPIGVIPNVLPEPEKRTGTSNFLFASTERNIAMAMQFYDKNYPDDHFVFDGKNVRVSTTIVGLNALAGISIQPSMGRGGSSPFSAMRSFDNTRSLLGNFLALHSGVMREGLLGGTLSTAWALLDAPGRKFKLKYKLVDQDGVKLHQLEYRPKSRRYLNAMEIRLFFDFETYRHVMSEYVFMGQVDPNYFLLEKFGNFRDEGGIILPHSYSIEFNAYRSAHPTLWVFEVAQVLHNTPIDPELFHVE